MAKQVSVSLEPKHIRAVERYGKKIGITAFSTALQALIHKFEQIELADKPEAPRPDARDIPETVAA